MGKNTNQLVEFLGQGVRALPRDLPPSVLQRWINDPGGFRKALHQALAQGKPVITVTIDQVNLPIWVERVEKDVAGPIGKKMKLEFIEIIQPGEDLISSKEMMSRARKAEAELGLLHAQAFLIEHCEDSFGLPVPTAIPFSGTVVVRKYGHQFIPVLVLSDAGWYLNWFALDFYWGEFTRLLCPSA